jgi:hypothetical protein
MVRISQVTLLLAALAVPAVGAEPVPGCLSWSPPDDAGHQFCIAVAAPEQPILLPGNGTPLPPIAHSRAYTVSEIDRMRAAAKRIIEGEYCMKSSDGPLLCPFPPQMDGITEDHLRTYMLGGVSPEELEREAGK